MKENHYPHSYGESQFHCPHCNVYAEQFWAHMMTSDYHVSRHTSLLSAKSFNDFLGYDWAVSKCNRCSKIALWLKQKMIYPRTTNIPRPNSDLNEDIKTDYEEAAQIYQESPRAAAAILRLTLQKLCIQLGEDGKNINDNIRNLVSKGLNTTIQKAFDLLRITGNNAVHPGEINLDENPDIVVKLFSIINFIAEKMITEPREIEEFYRTMPENALKAIERRDG